MCANSKLKISAGANGGGPCSRVCALLTLHSARINTSGKNIVLVSGGEATFFEHFLIKVHTISGNSEHFSGGFHPLRSGPQKNVKSPCKISAP